jgi:hypothetical protein
MLNHNNFYILGMPRCRSLWSSFLFTGGNSYCHHEALSESVTKNPRRLQQVHGAQLVGSTDTTPLSFNAEAVQDSPLILIHRCLKEVKCALAQSHGFTQDMDPTGYLERSYEHLNTIETDNTMHVEYGSLSDPVVIQRMLRFAGVSVSSIHISKLLGSRIVVNRPYLWMLKSTHQ